MKKDGLINVLKDIKHTSENPIIGVGKYFSGSGLSACACFHNLMSIPENKIKIKYHNHFDYTYYENEFEPGGGVSKYS